MRREEVDEKELTCYIYIYKRCVRNVVILHCEHVPVNNMLEKKNKKKGIET